MLPPPRQVLLIALCACTVHRSVAQSLSATLTTSNYNGFHISCFGAKDGSLQAVATGGTPPYTYEWSTAATTASIGSLAAGYYKVKVGDANANAVEVDITLQEPLVLKVETEPHTYPGGTNISCYNCYNGSIAIVAFQGVAPYSYEWSDGSTLEDRTGLGSASYSVKVTDANGCTSTSESVFLQEPERSDWTMTGNAGTDPSTHYFGTSDNKDVVFKANGQESLRLKSNGDISLMGSFTNEGVLYRQADGKLRLADDDDYETLTCRHLNTFAPYWKTNGNWFTNLCQEELPRLGNRSNLPLRIITNDQDRIIISKTGKVGIGTEPPSGAVAGYRLFVEDGIACRDVLVKEGAWPDFVFEPCYTPMHLDELRAYLNTERHLPGIPSAAELAANKGVELGDMQRRMLQVVEEQVLYILQLEKRLQSVEQQLAASNTRK